MNNELLIALSKCFETKIIHADYEMKQLQGGTVGDVQLLTGIAEDEDGKKLPYKLILKKQKKWERYGDVLSWRREYDLYSSDLPRVFTDKLSWPECYYSCINSDETHIWMEYVEGASGENLRLEMLEAAAGEVGRFQGRLYAEGTALGGISNLSSLDFMKEDYMNWSSETSVYHYIRSKDCTIPRHLCRMIIDMDNRAQELFEAIEKLPVVLCHRDLWLENIFYSDGRVTLIDWDTSGWGYMGEDIASLIADDTDAGALCEYYRRLPPAYLRGISEYISLPQANECYIREMILIKFGYRFVYRYINSETPAARDFQIKALQQIYDMKDIGIRE